MRAALIPDEARRPLPDPLLVQLIVGSNETEGQESFEVLVTSSAAIAEMAKTGPVLGLHRLVVDELDPQRAVDALRALVERVEGDTWGELVTGLRLIGSWEFDGYSE